VLHCVTFGGQLAALVLIAAIDLTGTDGIERIGLYAALATVLSLLTWAHRRMVNEVITRGRVLSALVEWLRDKPCVARHGPDFDRVLKAAAKEPKDSAVEIRESPL